MDELLGAVTRSTGIVALMLAVLALAWGFFFSSRDTGSKLRPAWWLDLHNWLGGLTLIFTGVHILASWLDSTSGVALADVFVPGLSGWAITFGVLATYLFATAVFTSWPAKLKKRPWWRIIHLGSVPATVFAFLHTIQLGSDSDSLWFRVAIVVSAAFATYGLGIRVFNLIARQWSSA
jgi:DMSO/TMAO reductase YedYZ heme-binding membrane subunit